MSLPMPDDDALYGALLDRDPSFDGHVFVCVRTTGVFCRLTCPARKPKRSNVAFRTAVADCLAEGYRPCLRCRPLQSMSGGDPLVRDLLARLDRDPQSVWSEDRLRALGCEPSTVRRRFRRLYGTSFLEMARMRRLARAAGQLAAGARVIDAQLDVGNESGSGFRDAVTRMLGDAPARLRGRGLLWAAWHDTPLGPMLSIADEQSLHLLEFVDRPNLAAQLDRISRQTGATPVQASNAISEGVAAWLRGYFADGAGPGALPLATSGTPFQRAVWQALAGIPPGTTETYAGLAERVGRPHAVRACAAANGANRIAIAIPCHRVVASNGALTGYGGGLWRKRWLIDHEAAAGRQRLEEETS
ncbi:MAG: trifunctional transcriptional activator/DNA repair protein Ada/methylated-DNA--[protein]-cysteine S-methyltransferase [Alphaproteobacteria bacterium]